MKFPEEPAASAPIGGGPPHPEPALRSSSLRGGLPNRLAFGSRYRGVRWRPEGFEMRCFECPSGARYWPLTTEFWNPCGLSRCRACWLVYWRRHQARLRREDPEFQRARERANYRKHRRVIAIKRREYYERNRPQILAKRRETYAARRAA